MSSESAPHLVSGPAAGRGERPEQPEMYLRGAVWPGTARVPYPRAAPLDRTRLPGDTWQMARIPVGVRLEFVGDADEVEIEYRTATADLGYRGDGAGVTFAAWHRGELLGEERASFGIGTVRLPVGGDENRTIVYLPEGMQPTVLAVRAHGGILQPAPPQHRWIVYGDSVAEGWTATAPALAWPAVAGRDRGLDVVNLGYAGAARGEIASAEQVAALDADLITVAHGTNCWTRTPHSVDLFRAGVAAFLDILRDEHGTTPIQVVSPVVRPDAEDTANRLGATLADLRDAMELEVAFRMEDDENLHLVRGFDLLGPEHLADGIHPNDEGHARMADAIGEQARRVIG